MKKLFTFLCSLLIVAMAFGQVSQDVLDKEPAFKTIDKNKVKRLSTMNSNAKSNERWYNYGETMDIFHANTSKIYGNNLFPDTTILVNYSSGYAGPWIHSLGDVLDVKSMFLNDAFSHPGELAMGAHSTFRVDSISFLCFYERNLNDPMVVDTLLFEVVVNNNLQSAFFVNSGINTNLGQDTVSINRIPYSYTANNINISTKKIYKFPLTQQFFADSLDNGLHVVDIATDDLPIVQAGKLVAASVAFIPGYTWVENIDTLTQKNRIFFLSFKEQEDAFPIYSKKDYNISYIIPQDVRYNDAGSWNGLYIPSFAYMGSTATYKYEHHLIYYKVVCETGCSTTGLNVLTNGQTILGDAYPNPQSKGNSINIPLDINDNNAVLTVRNILGQVFMTIDDLSIGKQNIEINTNQLQSGVYLYTLEVDNKTITKKFTISK